MEGSKKIGLVVGIILFMLLVVGATMAYWVWRGNIASVNTAVNLPFNCAADGGVHASTVALAPAACTHDRFAIKREITIDYDLFSQDTVVYMDMVLTIKSIGSGLSASTNFKYALTSSDDSCTENVISSGTFTSKTNGSTIKLLDNQIYDQVDVDVVNTYYLYIWIDAVEKNPDVLNQNFEFTLSLECTQGSRVIAGAAMLINKANDASITKYSEGDPGEMYTFNQPVAENLAAVIDYRYIGPNPRNYITFNDEVWRIIGVFDGKIKIVRDSSIGEMAWDGKQNGYGSSQSENGSNDWVDSQIMYMLNPNNVIKDSISRYSQFHPGYTFKNNIVKDGNNKKIYQKGCIPGFAGSTYECSSNTWKLNELALNQVVNTFYYIGGSDVYQDLSAVNYYTFERGRNRYSSSYRGKWYGKVGLLNPSDYGYTFAYDVNNDGDVVNQNKTGDYLCYTNLYNCNNGTASSSWLFTGKYEWTINPKSNDVYQVFIIGEQGAVRYFKTIHDEYNVRPVVYLSPDIYLTGLGTSNNPYTIVS